jgi:phosphomannomutase
MEMFMGKWFTCFKAYDIRGKVPSELNSEIAYAIGRAYADEIGAQKVCIGRDVRLSGPDLAEALTRGLNEAGVDTVDLEMVGTEMVYFATANYGYDGGIMITASHNPPDYNGMKMAREESRPISSDSGLNEIEQRAYEKKWVRSGTGKRTQQDIYADFKEHLLKQVDLKKLRPLRILANAGNGAAGPALEILLQDLPLVVDKMYFKPDGHFPNGVPNPILEESRQTTLERLKIGQYDFGVAWDGDYDRCFFFDEKGQFIDGYYIVGLLAQALLMKNPHQTIVHDPRLIWNTLDIVSRYHGKAVVCKSGHAFIKEKMREVDAIYGGEMSAHHYFRSHWYCDSGMIPFMLVLELLSTTKCTLGELVNDMIAAYPCSGEINLTVPNIPAVIKAVEIRYSDAKIDKLDGLSVEYPEWRFNLRGSNTEPVLRLNMETRGNKQLLHDKVEELTAFIKQFS